MREVLRGCGPLIAWVTIAWACAVWGVHHPAEAGWGIVLVGCAATLGTIVAVRRGSARVVTTVVCAGAIGIAVLTTVAVALPARDALRDAAGAGQIRIDAIVTGKAETSDRGVLFDARATVSDDRIQRSVDVVLRWPSADAALVPGATVHASGRGWATEAGRRAAIVIDVREGEVTAPAQGILAWTGDARARFRERAQALPGLGGGLLPGLAVGDTSSVADDLDAAMKTSALAHLTAVSGANCAIVVVLVYSLGALVMLGRRGRVVCAAIALAGFVMLVTPEPSVVRAAVMAGVAMVALVLGRPSAGIGILAVATTLALIADPWLATSIGFILSAASTAALLLFAGPLSDQLRAVLPAPLALATAASLSAQLACTPVLILLTPAVPVYGVVANLLAAPAAPVATIVGLLACLAAPLPLLADLLVWIAWLPATWIAGTAETMAQLPGSLLPWPEGGWGLVSLAGVSAALLVAFLARGPRLRITAVGIGALLAGLALLGGHAVVALDRLRLPAGWDVAACDVGQGDALVVRAENAVALVDVGREPELLESCLALLGIERVNLLVLTHFDADHVGGVSAVVGRVDQVLHGEPPDADAQVLLDELTAQGAAAYRVGKGDTGALGSARWEVLWPNKTAPAGNDGSVVLSVSGPTVPRTLLLGDLSATTQQQLGALDHFDIVKVAHHGSADQAATLYRAISADVALISVGENTYGHPHESILDTLTAAGSHVMRTDDSGLVLVDLRAPGTVGVWSERGGGPD